MLIFFYVLAASVIVTLVSLISAGFLYVSDERLKIWVPRLVAVAVGVLLGDAFLHLIPDAAPQGGRSTAFFPLEPEVFLRFLWAGFIEFIAEALAILAQYTQREYSFLLQHYLLAQ